MLEQDDVRGTAGYENPASTVDDNRISIYSSATWPRIESSRILLVMFDRICL